MLGGTSLIPSITLRPQTRGGKKKECDINYQIIFVGKKYKFFSPSTLSILRPGTDGK